MSKKIVITGPESTGKTTVARQLALVYETQWVPEYAREYIDRLDRPYQEADLLEIAKGQLTREAEMARKTDKLFFCDTSLEVIKIWSEYRYGRCHPWILDQLGHNRPDLYLLCVPDLPWEYDPQRENESDREELYSLYKSELAGQSLAKIWGQGPKRVEKAIEAVQMLLG